MNEIHFNPQPVTFEEEIQVGKLIAIGGEGSIHLAKWKGQTIALKKPHKANSNSLTKELHVFKTIMHPHVLSLLGEEPNKGWLLLPYMEKGALSSLLLGRVNETLPWLRRLQISRDITDGLQCLHENGILHCDLKSDNILLDGEYRAKLADFGIAQIKQRPELQFPWGGSLEYWSPELIPWIRKMPISDLSQYFPKNRETLVGKMPPFSEKSDIYALGIIFWEIAERRSAGSEIRSKALFAATELTPFAYKQWIQRCRAKAREQRPAASTLLQELSNQETEKNLLEEANKRLALTQIVLEENSFQELFVNIQDFAHLLFKIELPKELTEYQKELQREINALYEHFLLIKNNQYPLNTWQLDLDCLVKNEKYWNEMSLEQQQMLQQLICQYGWNFPTDPHWNTLESKIPSLALTEIYLYNNLENPHLLTYLHLAPNSERREYARSLFTLSFLWNTLKETLNTNTPCRCYEVAALWFQLLQTLQTEFSASQDPFIKASLPLFLKNGNHCMDPLIPRIHNRFAILLNDAKQSSLEDLLNLLKTTLLQWLPHYAFFQQWEWTTQLQTEVIQPALEAYLKKSDKNTFETIANQRILPYLRYYSQLNLHNLVETTYNWIRQLAINNSNTTDFDSIAFKQQIHINPLNLQSNIKPLPTLWQALSQNREDYENPKDYTRQVIKTLDQTLALYHPFLGEAPSLWSLLGLGSLGRGQLLPYSDLDIALLIENEEMRTHPHWQRLIHLLDTLTQVMDSAGYWDSEMESYLFLGHHIDGGDKKAMQGQKPLFIQTPKSFARWAAQTLHKVTKEDREKSTSERLLAYSCLNTCFITGTGQGLFSEYQTEIKKELNGKMDPISMVLAWKKEHAKDWQRALRNDLGVKKNLLSIKDSVFAPLNYYLLDHALLHLDKVEKKEVESHDWLELMQEARQKAFELRLTLEQRAKGRILLVKKEGDEKFLPKLTPFENAVTLTQEELLLIEQLQGLGAVAYNAIFNAHNTTHPLHIKGISLGEIHPTVQEYWATGIAATLTLGKEIDLKIHRRLYRLMSQGLRFDYENALKRFSKVAPQAEHLLKNILPHVPLPNGNRGSFIPRQQAWQKIIISLIEHCDPKNLPKESNGVLISWVENHQTRHGILKKEFAEQLLDSKGQFREDKKLKDGRRSVIPLCDKNKQVIVYPKAYPELPGRQLAADCLNYRISGSSVQVSLVLFTPLEKGKLNEKTAYPVLLSKPAGETIQNTIRSQKQLTKLSLYHFTLKVLATYLLGYEDDKKDNVTIQQTIDEMGEPCWQLVSIDSDHVFSTPMVDTTTDSKILLKTVTFTFPEMIEQLDPEAVADFRSLNKDLVLAQWLGECRLLNSALIGNLKEKRQGLFSPELIQRCAPLDSWFTSDKFSFIPIAFEPGTISDIYQRWQRVEQILKKDKLPSTHFDFLQQAAPRLGQRYKKVFDDHSTVGKRFDTLAELHTDYKVTKEKGTQEKEEVTHTSTHKVNVSKTLVGVKKFQDALMQGKIFDASGPFGVKELEEIQTHYQFLTELKKVFEVGLDVEDKNQQAVIETLELLLAKPYYFALIERVLAGVRFHYTKTNTDRLLAFQDKLLNLLSQKSLQQLTLIGWRALTEEKFLKLIEKSSDLQNLSIINCPNFKCSGTTWAKLSITCPQLKKLRITGVGEMLLSRRFNPIKFEELQSLHLEECPELTVYQINAPKLQHLTLKKCNKLIQVDLKEQPIQNLRLRNCAALSDEGFLHDVQGKHLQSLSLHKCPKIKEKDAYQQWSFLLGQQGTHYRDDVMKALVLLVRELHLKPHEISPAVTWILEQCEKARQCRDHLQSNILIIEKPLLHGMKHGNGAVCYLCIKALRVIYPSLPQEKQKEFFEAFLFKLNYSYSTGFMPFADALGKFSPFLSQEDLKKVLKALFYRLKNKVLDVRSAAPKALGVIYPFLPQEDQESALEALLYGLEHKDWDVRSACAHALSVLYPSLSQEKQKEVLKATLYLLNDKDSPVLSIRAYPLRKLYPFLAQEKQNRVFEALLSGLKEKNLRVRSVFIYALGVIYPSLSQERQNEVFEVLLPLLKDENYVIRLACATPLGMLYPSLPQDKQNKVFEALLSGLKDQKAGFVGATCAKTLGVIYPSLPQEKQKKVFEALLSESKAKNSSSACAKALGVVYPSLSQEKQKKVFEALLSGFKDNICSGYTSAFCVIYPFLPQEKQNKVFEGLLSGLKERFHKEKDLCAKALSVLYPSLLQEEQKRVFEAMMTAFKDDNVICDWSKALGVIYPFLPQEKQKDLLKALMPGVKDLHMDAKLKSGEPLSLALKNLSIAHYLSGQMPALRKLLDKSPPPQTAYSPINNKTVPSHLERMSKENSSNTLEGNHEDREKGIEVIGNSKGPIWYSNNELGKLLYLQLAQEKENSNSGVHLWAEASNVQQLETQLLYAASVQSKDKPVISIIPLFLNAQENEFHQVGNHWTVLILVSIPNQNENPRLVAIYQNPLGLEMPNSIKNQLKEWEIFDLQIKQQNNDNDCGPWVVYTAQTLVETLQESFPLISSKENLQKSILPLRESQAEELRLFYNKQLFKEQQSTSKVMNGNSSSPSLPSHQNDQYDDGKEDLEQEN